MTIPTTWTNIRSTVMSQFDSERDYDLSPAGETTKFMHVVKSISDRVDDGNLMLALMLLNRNLGTTNGTPNATGVWLDDIGDELGLQREGAFDDQNLFTFSSLLLTESPYGFSTSIEEADGGKLDVERGLRLSTLWDDQTYHAALLQRIRSRGYNASLVGLYNWAHDIGLDAEAPVVPNDYTFIDTTYPMVAIIYPGRDLTIEEWHLAQSQVPQIAGASVILLQLQR